MKSKLLIFTTLVLTMLFASCKSDSTADLNDLLSSVPADASMVMTIDLGNLAEKTGSKVEKGVIEPSAQLGEALTHIADTTLRADISRIVDGKAGVAATYVVIFTDGYYTYVSGMLADPSAFKASVEERTKEKFEEKAGVETCGRFALSDNRFWVCNTASGCDPLSLKAYVTLDSDKSFASTEYAVEMLGEPEDVELILNLKQMFSRMDMMEAAQAKIMLEAIYADPSYMGGSMEFEKGKTSLELSVLDKKYRVARVNFPTDKVKEKSIAGVAGSGDAVIACALSGKTVEKLAQSFSGFGGIAEELLAPFRCVDGTSVFVVSGIGKTSKAQSDVYGVVPVNGESTTALSNLLGRFGTVKRDAGVLTVSSATAPTGSVTTASAAGQLKGAMLGGVFSQAAVGAAQNPDLKELAVRLSPSEKGLKLEVDYVLADKEKQSVFLLFDLLGTVKR